MLVLSRECEETITIKFDDVVAEIKVIEIRGKRVRLGFTAPKDVIIMRGELEDRKSE